MGVDAPTDGQFDTIAAATAALCGTPIAMVSIVDVDRVRFAAATDLDGVTQVGTEPGLCASAFCVDGRTWSMTLSPTRAPWTTPSSAASWLQFYAAAPIVTKNGHHLGTVTAIDAMLRELTEAQATVLAHLADQVEQHLNRAWPPSPRYAPNGSCATTTSSATPPRSSPPGVRAAAAHAASPHPGHCRLGGAEGVHHPRRTENRRLAGRCHMGVHRRRRGSRHQRRAEA